MLHAASTCINIYTYRIVVAACLYNNIIYFTVSYYTGCALLLYIIIRVEYSERCVSAGGVDREERGFPAAAAAYIKTRFVPIPNNNITSPIRVGRFEGEYKLCDADKNSVTRINTVCHADERAPIGDWNRANCSVPGYR